MIDSPQQCSKCKKIKRLILMFILLGMCIQYLLSYDWLFSDLVFREYEAVSTRARAKRLTFGGEQVYFLDVSPQIKELILVGASTDRALSVLPFKFDHSDTRHSYDSQHADAPKVEYDAVYCAWRLKSSFALFGNSRYNICIFSKGNLVVDLTANVQLFHL